MLEELRKAEEAQDASQLAIDNADSNISDAENDLTQVITHVCSDELVPMIICCISSLLIDTNFFISVYSH